MMEYDREIDDLKALVTKALEKKGVLSKIRAQLRASVFQAIEEQDRVSGAHGGEMALVGGCSRQAKELHSSPTGRLLTGLVLEYLEWAELDHTVQIYLPEADLPESRPSRAQLADSLGLSRAAKDKERPLLMELLDARRSDEPASSSFAPTNPFAPPPPSDRHTAAQALAGASLFGPSTSSPAGVSPRSRDSTSDGSGQGRPRSPAQRYESPPSPSKVPTAAAFFTSSISGSSNGASPSNAAAFSDSPQPSPKEADQRSLLGSLPPLQKQALPSLSERRYAGLGSLGASQDEPGFAGLAGPRPGPSSDGTSSPPVISARTRRSSSESEESPRISPGQRRDRPATPSEERDISEEIEEGDLSVEASDLSVGSQPRIGSSLPDAARLARKQLEKLVVDS